MLFQESHKFPRQNRVKSFCLRSRSIWSFLLNGLVVPDDFLASAWRVWVLWWVSRPLTSCVSPVEILVRYLWLDSTWHFIRLWCIFNLRIFLHFFPQHISKYLSVDTKLDSFLIDLFSWRISFSLLPSRAPLGVFTHISIHYVILKSIRRIADTDMPLTSHILGIIYISAEILDFVHSLMFLPIIFGRN